MKKGISLIVLVITIIVMIIIAGAIIISLNSSNVIEKANEAVSASDLANARNAAMLKYAELSAANKGVAMVDGKLATADDYKTYLGNAGFDTAKFVITVNEAGIPYVNTVGGNSNVQPDGVSTPTSTPTASNG